MVQIRMSAKRKAVLAAILAIILGVHIALFAAGGQWRSVGKVLVVVDIVSGWFVFAAIRETRKLEHKD